MTAESDIDVLDTRLPVRQSMPASCFWEMAHLRPDRAALAGLAKRARADEAAHQERYTAAPQPRFVPAVAHEDTAADMGLPAGWYRDSFPREGMPQPASTDTILAIIDRAEAEEQEREQRSVLRRIWRWVRST